MPSTYIDFVEIILKSNEDSDDDDAFSELDGAEVEEFNILEDQEQMDQTTFKFPP